MSTTLQDATPLPNEHPLRALLRDNTDLLETAWEMRDGRLAIRAAAHTARGAARLTAEAQLLSRLDEYACPAVPRLLGMEDAGYVREAGTPLRSGGGRRAATDDDLATRERHARQEARENVETALDALHREHWTLGAHDAMPLGLRHDGSALLIDLRGLAPVTDLQTRTRDWEWVDHVLADTDRTRIRPMDAAPEVRGVGQVVGHQTVARNALPESGIGYASPQGGAGYVSPQGAGGITNQPAEPDNEDTIVVPTSPAILSAMRAEPVLPEIARQYEQWDDSLDDPDDWAYDGYMPEEPAYGDMPYGDMPHTGMRYERMTSEGPRGDAVPPMQSQHDDAAREAELEEMRARFDTITSRIDHWMSDKPTSARPSGPSRRLTAHRPEHVDADGDCRIRPGGRTEHEPVHQRRYLAVLGAGVLLGLTTWLTISQFMPEAPTESTAATPTVAAASQPSSAPAAADATDESASRSGDSRGEASSTAATRDSKQSSKATPGTAPVGPIAAFQRNAPASDPGMLLSALAAERHDYITGRTDASPALPGSPAEEHDHTVRASYATRTILGGEPVIREVALRNYDADGGIAVVTALAGSKTASVGDGKESRRIPAVTPSPVTVTLHWDGERWRIHTLTEN